MAILELVDYNEVAAPKKAAKKTKEAPVETTTVETSEEPKAEIKEEDVQDAEVVQETDTPAEETEEEKK